MIDTIVGNDINLAIQHLENGDLVALPTETVYGLAANAENIDAVSKIYQIKNRPQFNPLIIHVGNKTQLLKYVDFVPDILNPLIEKYMPGPLTLLLPKTNKVNDIVTAGSTKVAIRIPSNELSLKLLNAVDFAVAAPSANISGYVSPTTAQHVLDGLKNKIPYILDGGPCTIGIESTIIGINKENKIVLHRLGGLSLTEIKETIGEKIITDLLHIKPETPGQLKSHYATNTALYLGNIDQLVKDFNHPQNIVLINYSNKKNIQCKKQFVLTQNNNINEAASNLFSTLRNADNENADYIFAELAPNEGLGLAINDRLSRAQFLSKPS